MDSSYFALVALALEYWQDSDGLGDVDGSSYLGDWDDLYYSDDCDDLDNVTAA